ncbi:MAG: hypothetical protein PHW00_01270 [Clostridia bacterium]|nr:hypothetical protein [Clostridia bacterium]
MKKALIIYALLLVAFFLLQPTDYVHSFVNGINLWAVNVLPALFPFMVLSRLLAHTGDTVTSSQSSMKRVLGLPRVCWKLFLISCLCGYPIGAKLTEEFYSYGTFNRRHCYLMTALCSLPSPIFCAVTVGKLMFNNLLVGVVIYGSCVISSLILCILMNITFLREKSLIADEHTVADSTAIPSQQPLDNMNQSIMSILSVGAYIALFSVLCDMLTNITDSVSISNRSNLVMAYGLLEMTNGCSRAVQMIGGTTAMGLCAFYVASGGLCVYMQCLGYNRKCHLNGGKVAIIKLLQGAMAFIVSTAIIALFSL